ncbi:MAG: DNA ligase [Deltaproteobacteria bacterium]|nr:DNA ligase [Candidatus Zymogenaceae bacterium]
MPLFVIQKHHAKRLHYDFRLEKDGVLVSWAIPKGPSMTTSEKRLAVAVDDHDLSYAGYEGVIPETSYGAGPVMVWDTGTYRDISPAGWEKGRIEVELSGTKLVGKFALIQMKGRGEKNWLLMKMKDGREHRQGDILQTAPDSAKTGRSLEEIQAESPTPPPCEVKE